MDGQTTLGGFLDYWLETAIKDNVRQSTFMAYRGYIENHIKKRLGTETLTELKAERLQMFIAELRNDGVGLASKTVRSIFLMLRSALKCATEYEYIVKNPCDRVRLPKLEEKEIKVFDKSDQKRLERAISRSDDLRHYGILVCLYTGLRIGELCGLKWESVDFTHGKILIKNSINRVINYDGNAKRTMVVEVEPKTKKSRRTIPLPDFLVQRLKDLKRKSGSDYVISMKSGKAVEPRLLQIIYKKLLQAANVEYVSFHTLRHTFATRAIEFGVDVKTVSEILGHTNTMITINRYAHSLYEQKCKLMKMFDNMYRRANAYIFSSGIS
jgi:integrase